MIRKIDSNQLPQIGQQNQTEKSQQSEQSFKDTLSQFLHNVNEMQGEAKEATEAFLRGDITDLHQVTIAAQKARLSLELLLEIRNKMMDSYQEIMRMQI
ncbi:MAG: flagellar hook-basal body complex protein FliE [Calditrichia bacterium]